jgi:hypothetical protein
MTFNTVTRYYTSRDLDPETRVSLDTWSVYSEQYREDDMDNPIDGSDQWLSRWPNEDDAEKEANRLHECVIQIEQGRRRDTAFPIQPFEGVSKADHERVVAEKDDRIVQLMQTNERLRDAAVAREAEIRQTVLDIGMDVDEANNLLEHLGLEPIIHQVRAVVKLSLDVLVDVTNNDDTTIRQVEERLKRVLNFEPTVTMQMAGNELELREVEQVYVAGVESVVQAH